jgi:methylated-DNA-[protein]-cysteine S-methyltransferase
MSTLYWSSFQSPLGLILIASSESGVCAVNLPAKTKNSFFDWLRKNFPGYELEESASKNEQIMGELAQYFRGRPVRFRSKLDPRGTEFQRQVWSELRTIPYGSVITYKELAKRVGRPEGYQAVGRANAANPLPIVIPCHRVVGSEGDLVGYGAGIQTKEYLLRLEGTLIL